MEFGWIQKRDEKRYAQLPRNTISKGMQSVWKVEISGFGFLREGFNILQRIHLYRMPRNVRNRGTVRKRHIEH